MIAMQYGFTFPADYDMNIIRERIRTRGAALDGFPGLRFKSYLFTDRNNSTDGKGFNRYAPFYLWDDPRGMTAFLSSQGFAKLVADFGRPSVRSWNVLHAQQSPLIRDARWATLTQRPIHELQPLPDMNGFTQTPQSPQTLASLTAFDPAAWTSLEFSLWADPPASTDQATQCWEVGYVALA